MITHHGVYRFMNEIDWLRTELVEGEDPNRQKGFILSRKGGIFSRYSFFVKGGVLRMHFPPGRGGSVMLV